MKVLVTGHHGYIGSVLVPMLEAAGHEVTGLDSFLYGDCTFGAEEDRPVRAIRKDIRDVTPRDFAGQDAVVHLAALSNDPLGDLNPGCTYEINHLAAVRVARCAKAAGVERFLQSSSCSLYGAAGDEPLDESAAFAPVTPYAESKVFVERDVARLAGARFSPVFLRNATVYGASPRLRADLVVNNLVGLAYTTGKILITSDGSPWRPLVHVADVARAFLAVLAAPRERVHNEAFNVGRDEENYRIRDVAEIVREALPRSEVEYAAGGGPDLRCYRVRCGKIARVLPEFRPERTVRDGVRDLCNAYARAGLTAAEFLSARYLRIQRVRELLEAGRLRADLRWAAEAA